jgi:hypothetical protein
MHIGDKVRLLHDTQAGVVVRMLREDLAEVEIEDGFTIPVLTKELVRVADNFPLKQEAKETNTTPGKNETTPPTGAVLAANGIFIACLPQSEVLVEAMLVNNTDFTLAFTLSTMEGAQIAGLLAGLLKPREAVGVKSLDKRVPEQWPKCRLEVLYFHRGLSSYKPPASFEVLFPKKLFTQQLSDVPVLRKKGHWFQIDATPLPKEQGTATLLSSELFKPKKQESPPPPPLLAYQTEVDLHIEKLVENPSTLSPAEMLALQISRFEQALDQAIYRKQPSIIFIHGVGNGVLRTELHKRLSKHKQIRFFEDAQREKFGFGATKVQII